MRLMRVLAPTVALLGIACQTVIGADYSGYGPLPTQCDPLAPAAGEPSYANCATNQQCAHAATGFRCVPSAGTAASGEACSDDATCAQGLGCRSGFCRAYCDATAKTGCAASETCKDEGETGGGHALGACLKPCDLKTPSACDTSERCALLDGASTCAASKGNGQAYDTCSSELDCAQGLGCVALGHLADAKSTPVNVCLRWATQSSDCSTPERRITPAAAPTLGGATYGSCYAPCDPVGPTSPPGNFRACGGVQRCSFIQDAANAFTATACAVAGAATRDDDCVTDGDCGSKLSCRGFHNGTHCVDYCKSQGDCPAGRTCTAFTSKRSVSTTSGDVVYSYCAPPAPPCEPVTSNLCAGSERCDLVDDDYGICRPQGSGALGDYCTGANILDFCARGAWCVGNADYGSYCSQTCRVGGNDCALGKCQAFTGAPSPKIGTQAYGYCPPPNCDPFKPQGASLPLRNCPNGTECHFVTSSQTACRSGGGVAGGGSCKYSADCGAGLFCIYYNSQTTGLCKVPCRVTSGSADCVSRGLKTCDKLSTPFVIDGVEYGTCS